MRGKFSEKLHLSISIFVSANKFLLYMMNMVIHIYPFRLYASFILYQTSENFDYIFNVFLYTLNFISFIYYKLTYIAIGS